MSTKQPYIWTPGIGPSHEAIARIRSNSHQPRKPMGEAWFMGEERRMYTELTHPNAVKKMDLVDLSMILQEIGSGTKCFGHLDEWDQWFRFLLPDLIERSVETIYFDTNLFQIVITDFMATNWKGIDEHYSGFRNDVLASLLHTPMDPTLWELSETPPRPTFLDLQENGVGELKLFWGFGSSDPTVSAAIFFCLKYLRPEELNPWVNSLTGIEHPLWQGNLMTWFVGAFDFLKSGSIVPEDIKNAKTEIDWDGSLSLGSSKEIDHSIHLTYNDPADFIPRENVSLFFERMNLYYTEETLLKLAHSFIQNEHLGTATFRVPESLWSKLGV